MNNEETNKITLNLNLIEAYKAVNAEFKSCINEMNKLWYGVVRLLITLSTSILLISIGLIDKIFPLANSQLHIKSTLVIGWILFFLSIIFGIFTELKGAEFFGKMAKESEILLKNYLKQMTEGQPGKQEVNLKERFIVYPSLFWGLSEIVTFIFGVLCLSIYAIGNIYKLSMLGEIAIIILTIIIVLILIVRYFKSR